MRSDVRSKTAGKDVRRSRAGDARWLTILRAMVLAGALFVLAGEAPAALAATIVVDTALDGSNVDGNCTLREAIAAANTDTATDNCAAGSGADTIVFNIGGTAFTTRTIAVSAGLGQLPSITTPVTIDGWSQGVYDGTAGYTGVPLVEIDGRNVTTVQAKGLLITNATANGVTIQGLTINGFASLNSVGIVVQQSASNVTVKGCYIGVNAAGTAAAANGNGMQVGNGVTGVTIGGSTAADRNVISGNSNIGIMHVNNPSNVTIKGNYIGLNAAGTAALGNGGNGINVVGQSSSVTIGGSSAGEGNVISGNGNAGVNLAGSAQGVTIKGNLIGLNAAGTSALGNGQYGINISSASNTSITIGGTAAGDGNVISGQTSGNAYGIGISGGAHDVTVQGNYVGTDVTGTAAVGNGWGIVNMSDGVNNVVGGAATGAGNLVSGNTTYGIALAGTGTGSLVQGNLLGTDAAGTGLISSGGAGIFFGTGATTITVGGTTAAARNVIVGFPTAGIDTVTIDTQTNATAIQGNYIGVMPDGTTAGANGLGVRVRSGAGYTIGGTAAGAGNVIANNTGKGVVVTGSDTGAQIRGNSIFNNGTTASHLGIDLNDDGVTANDSGDVDTGPNGLQNFPVLTSAGLSGGATRVTGTLNGAASTTLQIDVYANDSCDTSGYGEARTFVGSTSVTTNGSGNGSFALLGLPVTTLGQAITATATNAAAGVTSELSLCRTVVAPSVAVTPTSGLITTEAGGTATFTVQLAVVPTSQVTIGVSSSTTAEGTVSPQTLTFQADASGVVAQTVTVTGADDAVADGNVGYTVLLGAAASSDLAYSGVDPTDVTVTNQDNEGAPSLSVQNVQAAEGNSGTSSLTFTVSLSPASSQTVTVNYATSNGTATGGASCGTGIDYVNASGPLTFTPGDTSKPVAVTLCGDMLSEADETLTLTLSTPSNATISQATATGTIRDSDLVPSLSVADATVAEGNSGTSSLQFVVTMSVASGQAVTVQYATGNDYATGGAACGAGVDYVNASGTLTFAPGETSKQVPVTVCGDTVSEMSETLTFTLSNPTNARITQHVATGTIQNDDGPLACLPRPAIGFTSTANGGKLYVTISSHPLNTNQPNPIQQLGLGVLQNARVTLNGQQILSNQVVNLPANTSSVILVVERVTAGQTSTVPLTVVDGCGPWRTFVGAGAGNGF